LICVVFVVAIVVVLSSVFVAVFFVRPPNAPAGSPPRVIGVSLAVSSDGTNWLLTFTSVPTALSPYNTMLTILSSAGATYLPATPLPSLNYSSEGAFYSQNQ